MLGDIIFIAIVFGAIYIILYNYQRAKRMIQTASNALFPEGGMYYSEVMTATGNVELLGFQTKAWRTKRLLLLITLGIFIVLSSMPIFSESFSWTNGLIFLAIASSTLNFNKVPSFIIQPKGIYIDERFFRWEKIKYFSISPVKLGSPGYGMFDNSTDYLELKIKLKNGVYDPNYIFLQDEQDGEKIRKLLLENGVPEQNNQTKKQQTI